MRIGGKGTPWLAHKVFPSPQAPHPSPTRFFREDGAARRRCRFSRGNRPPGTRRKRPLEASQRDNSVSNSKSPPVWRAFAMYGKTGCRKNLSSPLALLPDQRRQEGRPPAFPAPSQAGAQDTRRELQDFRSYACGCAPNVQLLRKKEPTTPHESETPQRPSEDTGDGRQEANYDGPAPSHPPE